MRVDITEASVRLSSLTGAKIDEVDTTRFARAFLGQERPPTGILSPAVRWISRAGNAVIVERPPQVMTVYYRENKGNEDEPLRTFKIPIPWQVYAVGWDTPSLEHISGMWAFARTSQIYSPEDTLSPLWVPNVFPDGVVCGAEDLFLRYASHRAERVEAGYGWKLADATNFVINSMWLSPFNSDTGNPLSDRVPFPIPGSQSDPEMVVWDDMDDSAVTLEWLEAQALPEVLTWDLPCFGEEYGAHSVATLMEMLERTRTETFDSTLGLILSTVRQAKKLPKDLF